MGDANDRVRLKMVNAGEFQPRVIQVLSKVKGLPQSPDELVNSTPCVIADDVPRSVAEKLQGFLEKAGARMQIEDAGAPEEDLFTPDDLPGADDLAASPEGGGDWSLDDDTPFPGADHLEVEEESSSPSDEFDGFSAADASASAAETDEGAEEIFGAEGETAEVEAAAEAEAPKQGKLAGFLAGLKKPKAEKKPAKPAKTQEIEPESSEEETPRPKPTLSSLFKKKSRPEESAPESAAEQTSLFAPARDAGDAAAEKGVKAEPQDAAGGMAYLVEVSSAIPTSAMFRYMLKTVVDAALLRRVLRVCDEAVEKCCEEGAVAEVEELTCKLARDVQLVADFAIRQQGVQSMADSARAAREEVLEVAEGRVDKSRQLTWPLAAIDAKFLPIDVRQEDWFNLIAAPPSGGKSALLRWLANAWLSEGKCGLVFLLETSKKRWLQALAASVVGINLRFLEDAAKLYPDRWAAFLARLAEVEAWCGERLFIYDDVFLLEDIERITEKHNRELLDAKLRAGVSEDLRKKVSGLGFVVGDYLQIVETRQRFLKKAEQLDYICPRLKKLHRRLNVPGFWGSQITRSAQNEKRRPMLYDLSDSSGLCVTFTYVV